MFRIYDYDAVYGYAASEFPLESSGNPDLFSVRRNCGTYFRDTSKMKAAIAVVFFLSSMTLTNAFVDNSVKSYQAERTCGYNEVCKEEFRKVFRCKCPSYLYCRSHGKYYNALCSITDTGYIWLQNPYELSRTP